MTFEKGYIPKSKGRGKSKLKKILRCKKCWFVWKRRENTLRQRCPICQHPLDARDRTGIWKEIIKRKPELREKKELELKKLKKRSKEMNKINLMRTRLSAMMVITNGKKPMCGVCGCDDYRFLEINHKNCDGAKENREKYGHVRGKLGRNKNLYWDIIKFRRKTNDLNILCKLCNQLHYLNFKFGKQPFKIRWSEN